MVPDLNRFRRRAAALLRAAIPAPLCILLFGATASLADEVESFAGEAWTYVRMPRFLTAYEERNRATPSGALQNFWKSLGCDATPFSDVAAAPRYCFTGKSRNGVCGTTHYLLVVPGRSEDIMVHGRFSTTSRCSFPSVNIVDDIKNITVPVKSQRPVHSQSDAKVLGNAHVLRIVSMDQHCFGFRDYGLLTFSTSSAFYPSGYASTSTGHVCRKDGGPAYSDDEMLRKMRSLDPVLRKVEP